MGCHPHWWRRRRWFTRNCAAWPGVTRSEGPGHTLQPTALLHEAFLRMVARDAPDCQNRSHFYGVASHLMRQILIDHARIRNAGKRGGGKAHISL